MKLNHKKLVLLAGCVWLAIGVFLLSLGIQFILATVRDPSLSLVPNHFSLSHYFSRFTTDKSQAASLMIIFCLVVGYFKGKMALAKSVTRQIKRIESLPNPAHLKYLYSKGYYLLIALMISLGVIMRFLPITLDTRGAIDTIIGSALINGAMLYFRNLSRYSELKKKDS